MAHNVTFDYDKNTNKVIVDDNGTKSIFVLNDNRSKLFYYILQAIDDLDSGSGSVNADWEEEDKNSKSYVKNRSHYIDRTYSESASFTFKSGTGDSTAHTISPRLQPEYIYNITVNGYLYENITLIPAEDLNGNSFYYFGNPKLDSSLNELEGNDYTFLFKAVESTDSETGNPVSNVYFFSDEAGEYSVKVVNTGETVAPVPHQREYVFDGTTIKDFFTFPTDTLPESISLILNYISRNLQLVEVGDANLFYYGNSDIVKNYLILKGIDPSIVEEDTDTDFEMAFIGILDGDKFVFHGFSKSEKQLVLQVQGAEEEDPFFEVTPITIATEGCDIEIPEASLEPYEFDATCANTETYKTLKSSLPGIEEIFVDGRTLCATINGEKYTAEIVEESAIPTATFDLDDEKSLVISLYTDLTFVANFLGDVDVIFKSVTSEEFIPMDSKFIPSTTSISESSTDDEFPTAKAVWERVRGGVIYKGTVASASDLPEQPGNGWAYIATDSFVVDDEQVDAGDLLIYNEEESKWNIVQGNISIDDLQSNWNENDSTSSAYVWGRTHWIETQYSNTYQFSFTPSYTSTEDVDEELVEIWTPEHAIQPEYLYNITIKDTGYPDPMVFENLAFKNGSDLAGNDFIYCGNPKLDQALNNLPAEEYPFLIKSVQNDEGQETVSEVSIFFEQYPYLTYLVTLTNTGILKEQIQDPPTPYTTPQSHENQYELYPVRFKTPVDSLEDFSDVIWEEGRFFDVQINEIDRSGELCYDSEDASAVFGIHCYFDEEWVESQDGEITIKCSDDSTSSGYLKIITHGITADDPLGAPINLTFKEAIGEEYIPLDEQFIPDTIARVPEWEVKDIGVRSNWDSGTIISGVLYHNGSVAVGQSLYMMAGNSYVSSNYNLAHNYLPNTGQSFTTDSNGFFHYDNRPSNWNLSPFERRFIEFYDGNDHSKLLCSTVLTLNTTAKDISDGVFSMGYATGNQVYAYSEAKANKTTSISDQSTDTQYPSALAVKTYVDQNGFQPANMETVTDPVTLNQAQSDWNQADSNAKDFIKNKPTIPDVYKMSLKLSATDAYINIYKNDLPCSDTLYLYYFYGSSYGGGGGNGRSVSSSSVSLTGYPFNDTSNTHWIFTLYNSSSKTKVLDEICVIRNSASISQYDIGYTLGKQVYNYAEDKSNKVTSIGQSSTDTQYPSALAVKTYVDNNGFNPSSMETVTDPVTLDTPQADWNQADSTAPDYIKNKPTVSDSWELTYLGDYWDGSDTWVYFTIRKNGIEQTSGNFSSIIAYGFNIDGIGLVSVSLQQFQYDSINNKWIGKRAGQFPSSVARIRYTLYVSSDESAATLVYRKANSIAANDQGYVTGDQVNTVVGNIETLLAQI